MLAATSVSTFWGYALASAVGIVIAGVGVGVGKFTRDLVARRKDEKRKATQIEHALVGVPETEFAPERPGLIEQVSILAGVVAGVVKRQADHEKLDAELAEVFWGHTHHPPTPPTPQRRAS